MEKHSYRITILLLFVLSLPSALIAQEQLTFVAVKDTVANNWEGEELKIHTGALITTGNMVGYGRIASDLEDHHLLILFGEPGNRRFYTLAKYFRPAYTVDVFGEDIFIDYPMDHNDQNFINTWGNPPAAIGDAMWVPYFYADILREQDRNMLLIRCPRLEIRDDEGNPWYENSVVNLLHGRAMFYNSAVMLGMGTHIAVRNIERTDFGYIVDSIVSTLDWRTFWGWLLAESSFWETYNRGDAVTLLLHLDGDYLDIYTAGTDIHVGTFIKVGREFQTQYQSLIRHNISDLTNVQWPRRADGSMDFPPPVVSSNAPAQQVAEETVEIADYFEDQESAIVQQNASASSMPLWVWLAIVGGVVVIVAAAVVVKRKR